MNQVIFKHIATQGVVGYTAAPGTMATLMTMPLVYFLSKVHLTMSLYIALLVVAFCFSLMVVHKALPFFDEPDPYSIVVDEMVGFLVVFVAVPFSWQALLIGFIVFRLLDIYKLFGIAYVEQIPGALGIMLDDVAAALLTNLFLHFLLYLHWLS